MGNFSCESREQNRKDKVTGLRSVTYVRQQGLLVNILGSHLKVSSHGLTPATLVVFFHGISSTSCRLP